MYLNSTPISSRSEILPEIKQEPSRYLKLDITQLCSCLGFCGELLSHPHGLQLCLPYTAFVFLTTKCTGRPWPCLSFGYERVFQGIIGLWPDLQAQAATRSLSRAKDLKMFISSKYSLTSLTSVKNKQRSIAPRRGARRVISNKKQNGKTDSNQCEMQQIDLGSKSSEQNKSLVRGGKKMTKGIFQALKEDEGWELGTITQRHTDVDKAEEDSSYSWFSYGARPAGRSAMPRPWQEQPCPPGPL